VLSVRPRAWMDIELAAMAAAEQVALCGGVPVADGAAAVVVGAGAG
jgi:hypothetical protein